MVDKNKRNFFKKIGAAFALGALSALPSINALQNINFSDGSTQAVAYHGTKNLIINGNFDIWQRGTSASISPGGVYVSDR